MAVGKYKKISHLTIGYGSSISTVYTGVGYTVSFRVTNDGESILYNPVCYIYDRDTLYTTLTYTDTIAVGDTLTVSFTGPSAVGTSMIFYAIVTATDEYGDTYESEKSLLCSYYIMDAFTPDIPIPDPTPSPS